MFYFSHFPAGSPDWNGFMYFYFGTVFAGRPTKKKQALHFERAEVAHHVHLNLAIELIYAQKYLKWSPFNTLQILRYLLSFSCPAPNENSLDKYQP